MKKILLFTGLLCASLTAGAQVVTTFSGTGEAGYSSSNSDAAAAKYDMPYAAVIDSKGNTYVVDENNSYMVLLTGGKYLLRSGDYNGGFADGSGAGYGKFNYPKGAVIGAGDTVYIIDNGNSAIRALAPFKSLSFAQQLKTIAGGSELGQNGQAGYKDGKGMAALFNLPTGIAISPDKTYLLVADQANEVIRKVVISGADYGKVTTFAGKAGVSGGIDGTALQATFSGPEGIFIDSTGVVYVAERFGGIRKIADGSVSTLISGDALENPVSLIIKGIDMYIADGCHIKHFNMVTQALKIFAGQDNTVETACDFADGTGANARFYDIGQLTLSADKTFILVADRVNNRIRKMTIPAVTVGTKEHKMAVNNINIYPNPANQYIMIEGANMQNAVVTLFDMTGRKVAEQLVNSTTNAYRFDIATQDAGLYILQVSVNGNLLTKRIAVAK
ncbi:MAG: T9SS type A sorting domain-containing protein [Bacteroidia bacterium]